ncbi:hypothetical protein GQ44DRAFT_753936 [Phaeosphaeriaceae sp. PMI808]|nr:hypothetical protein GQ44DRAFT_753936 [Phaeosphaeriaceae sp. PMI808]
MVNLVGATVILATVSATFADENARPTKPIILEKSGGFSIGGKVLKHPVTNQSLSCDHGYLEYFIPWRPRKTNLVMWHSSSTQTWQNRWDGGEGYKDMFLRRNYPVWLWDAPRLGRANWACEPYTYFPSYAYDESNWVAWNLGPSYKVFWPDVQFPTKSAEAWQQATSNRYVEFDTIENIELQSNAAAIAADSGKVGTNIVYLTNSAAGARALFTTIKSNTTNIKAIVAYETFGSIFPDTANVTAGGPFGPFVVPLEQFKKLTKIPLQFVWGDHRAENFTFLEQNRRSVSWINMYGGDATILKLGELKGMRGNTHVAFADLSNERVAGLLDKFLEEYGLDDYQDGDS